MRPFYVYILRCVDGSLYVGQTSDLDVRMGQHSIGHGYTGEHHAAALVHAEEFGTREEARLREHQIKNWSRAKKEALVAGDFGRVKELAKCYGQHGAPSTRAEGPQDAPLDSGSRASDAGR
ncbi:MAG: GIY-YIG nuclease family protein [Planctomycetota bacterium]